MNHTDLINKFYRSFSEGNAEDMVSCYGDGIIFSDPAFGTLQGDEAKNMWRMLINNAKGKITITHDNVKADDQHGSADWIAEYDFSKTGRRVINKISARFEFAGGKIVRHTDHFDLWKWSEQALGWKGYLLGWTPFMKKQIRKQANALLKKYTQQLRNTK